MVSRESLQFYDQIASWVLGFLGESLGLKRPLIVGINGPQGGGKTTLTGHLVELIGKRGFRSISLSVDDFYLTRADQVRLSGGHRSNPYLQSRGYPGTHDVKLGCEYLDRLKNLRAGESVRVPAYDKSLHGGKGDRAHEDRWPTVTGPLDVIFFEGWMLGFSPVLPGQVSDSGLNEVNELLRGYQAWVDRLDIFLQLKPQDHRFVLDWRVEAEERMKAAGKPGMNRSEVEGYIRLFLKAYEIYLPQLERVAPCPQARWIIPIGKNRLPL